jgi:hypothetical protein
MKGRSSWDTVFPNPAEVRRTASFWLENIDRFNGRRWWPRVVTVRATVDASGIGYGGFIQAEEGPQIPFMGTFTAQQSAESSTAREVRGYAAALDSAARRFRSQIQGAAILLEGDNQGAIADLNQFRSTVPEINEVLRRVFELCCEVDFDVVAKWVPRDDLPEADALSRQPDRTHPTGGYRVRRKHG